MQEMSTETYADVEDIQKDGEEATDKILNIRVPVKQHSGSSVGSRRSSVSHVSAIKQRIVGKEQRAGLGRKGVGEEKDKNGKVQFEVVKETGRQKLKSKVKTKKKKGIRTKSASSSRSRSREKIYSKTKKAIREETVPKAENDDSEDDPDVSEIVLTKPQIKNISLDGVLPGELYQVYLIYNLYIVLIGKGPKLKAPPENLSPRSAAEYTRKQINFSPKKKNVKGKRKYKKSIKMKKKPDSEMFEQEELLKEKDRLLKEELAKLDPKKAPTKQDSSFYPPPSNLEKRRCYFHKGAKALKCTVCSGGKLL